jgi:hypothetical protein
MRGRAQRHWDPLLLAGLAIGIRVAMRGRAQRHWDEQTPWDSKGFS